METKKQSVIRVESTSNSKYLIHRSVMRSRSITVVRIRGLSGGLLSVRVARVSAHLPPRCRSACIHVARALNIRRWAGGKCRSSVGNVEVQALATLSLGTVLLILVDIKTCFSCLGVTGVCYRRYWLGDCGYTGLLSSGVVRWTTLSLGVFSLEQASNLFDILGTVVACTFVQCATIVLHPRLLACCV